MLSNGGENQFGWQSLAISDQKGKYWISEVRFPHSCQVSSAPGFIFFNLEITTFFCCFLNWPNWACNSTVWRCWRKSNDWTVFHLDPGSTGQGGVEGATGQEELGTGRGRGAGGGVPWLGKENHRHSVCCSHFYAAADDSLPETQYHWTMGFWDFFLIFCQI